MSPQPDSLLTIEDVAQTLAISKATVWRHVKAGLLPKPIKIGAATRWRWSGIQTVIERAESDAA